MPQSMEWQVEGVLAMGGDADALRVHIERVRAGIERILGVP
jgi:hypothetical protein